MLWFVSTAILALFGFSFAAVLYAPVLELIIWVSLAGAVHAKFKNHETNHAVTRLAPLLVGVLITSMTVAITMVIYHA